MDKKLLLAMMAICCLFANKVSAQERIRWNDNFNKGFYFRIGGGYSLGIAKTSGGGNGLMPTLDISTKNITKITGTEGNRESTSSNSTTQSNAAYSLGEGINMSLGLGYMLNKNVGIELGVNYLMGAKTSVVEKTVKETQYNHSVTIGSTTYMGGGKTSNITTKEYNMTRNALSLAPAIKLVAPMNGKIALYSRFGVVVPILDKVDYEYRSYTENISTRPENELKSSSGENKTTELNSYINIGYTAAIGLQYNIGKSISLFAEVNLVSYAFEVKKGTITSWNQYNNPSSGSSTQRDLTENLDVWDKETEYIKNYVVDDNTPSLSKDDPKKEASFSLPATSLGVTIGFAFRF